MIFKLRIQYFITIVLALVLVVLFEFCGLDKPTVLLEPQTEFWLTTIITLLTIGLVPLSLKLLTFERVKAQLKADEQSYFRWATIRWALLSLTIVGNVVFYYVFSTSTTCGYLALLSAVAYLFLWPSESRMTEECQQ